MTEDALIARLRAIDYTAPHDDLCHEAAARIAALELRISGYQASRDYAIDLLAKALGIEPDKMRAVEYYAREAADRIAALTAENAKLTRLQERNEGRVKAIVDDELLDRATKAEPRIAALTAENSLRLSAIYELRERLAKAEVERGEFEAKWYQSNKNLHAAWGRATKAEDEAKALRELLRVVQREIEHNAGRISEETATAIDAAIAGGRR